MGNALVVPNYKEVGLFHSLKILIIVETRNQEATMAEVTKKLHFDHFFIVNPICKSGGICLL